MRVRCNYPGASAQVVAETVASPIEQQVNGVENMLYMSSQCTNDGSYDLAVTFKHGVNLNMAQVLVQNRVNLALASLPEVLRQTGVTTRKLAPDMLMTVSINSPTGRYDQLLPEQLRADEDPRRVGPVAGSGRRIHHWAVRLQHADLGESRQAGGSRADGGGRGGGGSRTERAGGVRPDRSAAGPPPVRPTQITLSTLGRLVEPEQFANIVVRAAPDGRLVRIKDIGRVELGAKNVDVRSQLDGKGLGGPDESPNCPTPTPWRWPTAFMRRCGSWPRVFPRR